MTQDLGNADAPIDIVPLDQGEADLVATRLRQNAARVPPTLDGRLPWYAVERAVSADLGHLHAAHDLRSLPFPARGRLTKPFVVWFRRLLRRGLYPVPDAQSVWNGANARVVTFMLRQLAAHERTIESLERQLAELHRERRQ